MPLATIKVIAGVFNADQKRQMIEKVTDALVAVEGEGLRDKTVVIMEEVKSGDWAVGGRPISAEAARELQAAGSSR